MVRNLNIETAICDKIEYALSIIRICESNRVACKVAMQLLEEALNEREAYTRAMDQDTLDKVSIRPIGDRIQRALDLSTFIAVEYRR